MKVARRNPELARQQLEGEGFACIFRTNVLRQAAVRHHESVVTANRAWQSRPEPLEGELSEIPHHWDISQMDAE